MCLINAVSGAGRVRHGDILLGRLCDRGGSRARGGGLVGRCLVVGVGTGPDARGRDRGRGFESGLAVRHGLVGRVCRRVGGRMEGRGGSG